MALILTWQPIPRQFQSHLQNKLTAVVRNDWRKHVWFRAASLKFKWDFKVQSEESILNRIRARGCSRKGFHRGFSSSPCDPAQPISAKLPVTAKAPDPATGPTKETNVPALSEIVKSLDVTINELTEQFEKTSFPAEAMQGFANSLDTLRLTAVSSIVPEAAA